MSTALSAWPEYDFHYMHVKGRFGVCSIQQVIVSPVCHFLKATLFCCSRLQMEPSWDDCFKKRKIGYIKAEGEIFPKSPFLSSCLLYYNNSWCYYSTCIFSLLPFFDSLFLQTWQMSTDSSSDLFLACPLPTRCLCIVCVCAKQKKNK